MEHEVHGTGDIEGLGNVVLDELEGGMAFKVLDIPGMAGDEIVEGHDAQAVRQEAVDQVGGNESGTTGHDGGFAFQVLDRLYECLSGGERIRQAAAPGRLAFRRSKPWSVAGSCGFPAASSAAPGAGVMDR